MDFSLIEENCEQNSMISDRVLKLDQCSTHYSQYSRCVVFSVRVL